MLKATLYALLITPLLTADLANGYSTMTLDFIDQRNQLVQIERRDKEDRRDNAQDDAEIVRLTLPGQRPPYRFIAARILRDLNTILVCFSDSQAPGEYEHCNKFSIKADDLPLQCKFIETKQYEGVCSNDLLDRLDEKGAI